MQYNPSATKPSGSTSLERKAPLPMNLYAVIVEEAFDYAYRFVIGEAPPTLAEGENVLHLFAIQATELDEETLTRGHQMVFSHLGEPFEQSLADEYIVPNTRYKE